MRIKLREHWNNGVSIKGWGCGNVKSCKKWKTKENWFIKKLVLKLLGSIIMDRKDCVKRLLLQCKCWNFFGVLMLSGQSSIKLDKHIQIKKIISNKLAEYLLMLLIRLCRSNCATQVKNWSNTLSMAKSWKVFWKLIYW